MLGTPAAISHHNDDIGLSIDVEQYKHFIANHQQQLKIWQLFYHSIFLLSLNARTLIISWEISYFRLEEFCKSWPHIKVEGACF